MNNVLISGVEPTSDLAVSVFIGNFIRKKRRCLGLSGHELASRLYISQQQVSKYECGKSSIHIEMLLRIIRVLNIGEKEITDFFCFISSLISPVQHSKGYFYNKSAP